MNMGDMLREEDFHIRYLKQRISDVRERIARGEREVTISLDQLEGLYWENLTLNRHLDRAMQQLGDAAKVGFMHSTFPPILVRKEDVDKQEAKRSER